MDYQEKIKELFTRYLADQCSEEELHILMDCFNKEDNAVLLKELIKEEVESSQNINDQKSTEAREQFENIFESIKKRIEGSE